VDQVVGAFAWREDAKDVGDGISKLVLCSRGGLAQALRDCRYLLHDRDTKYTQSFRAIIASG
jgi:hypothetical protein